MKKFKVRVKFPWWKNGVRVPDRFGTIIELSGEYTIQPDDLPKEKIRLYWDEFTIIGLSK